MHKLTYSLICRSNEVNRLCVIYKSANSPISQVTLRYLEGVKVKGLHAIYEQTYSQIYRRNESEQAVRNLRVQTSPYPLLPLSRRYPVIINLPYAKNKEYNY